MIAMQFRVHDDVARHFMSVLYHGLVMGDSVDSALSRARLAMCGATRPTVTGVRPSSTCELLADVSWAPCWIPRRARRRAGERTDDGLNAAFQHWRDRQALANREQLEYLEGSGANLDATATDLLILTRSALACDTDTWPWVSRFSTVGDALVRRLELGEGTPAPPIAASSASF